MYFVYPAFLFALSLLTLPIIIHLFNFRKFKKIYFTNVKFLKEIKEETSSQSRLKHLLVLLSRILAVSFLVFAFAQPYFPLNSKTVTSNEKAVSIYVDNSFSMESISRDGTLLDEAKKKAYEIAMAYRPSDNFQLITNDFEARHQRLVNREEFFDLLDQVKTSPSSKNLSETILRQHDALNNSDAKQKLIYILSDYQKTISDFENTKPDRSVSINLIPLDVQPVTNIFIDSCWFTSPVILINKPSELYVRIKNSSDADVENVSLKLTVNGIQKSIAGVVAKANSTTDTKLNFTVTENGWQKGELSITDHPITFDDTWFFSFNIKQNLKLLSINQKTENAFVKALYGSDSYFILNNTNVEQIDYSALPLYDVVILNSLYLISSGLSGELKKYVENGGSLVVFPDTLIDESSYNNFLISVNADTYIGVNSNEDKVEQLRSENVFFQNVFDEKQKHDLNIDMPIVFKHYEFSGSTLNNREVIMKLQGGASFLSKFESGKGILYLFSVPLNLSFSNFVKHSIFVPALYKIALLSEREQKLFNIIGKEIAYHVDETSIQGDQVFHLVNESKKFDIIPEHRNAAGKHILLFNNQVKESGNYNLMFNNKPSDLISFNYDRKESIMNFYTKDDLNKIIADNHFTNMKLVNTTVKGLTMQILEAGEGIKLWKWSIFLVLIFLGVEILLLKFWR